MPMVIINNFFYQSKMANLYLTLSNKCIESYDPPNLKKKKIILFKETYLWKKKKPCLTLKYFWKKFKNLNMYILKLYIYMWKIKQMIIIIVDNGANLTILLTW